MVVLSKFFRTQMLDNLKDYDFRSKSLNNSGIYSIEDWYERVKFHKDKCLFESYIRAITDQNGWMN